MIFKQKQIEKILMALALFGVLCFGFGCRWTAKGPVSYFHIFM